MVRLRSFDVLVAVRSALRLTFTFGRLRVRTFSSLPRMSCARARTRARLRCSCGCLARSGCPVTAARLRAFPRPHVLQVALPCLACCPRLRCSCVAFQLPVTFSLACTLPYLPALLPSSPTFTPVLPTQTRYPSYYPLVRVPLRVLVAFTFAPFALPQFSYPVAVPQFSYCRCLL